WMPGQLRSAPYQGAGGHTRAAFCTASGPRA
ncbi:hypothetical protein AK812_SmicGene47525, partial [Symbiodinium microadriaticum]